MEKGIVYALVAAALFGVSTPLAKALVGQVSPVMLAGLLYLGSGFGLGAIVVGRLATAGTSALALPRGIDWVWLAGAIFFGGILGPVALMYGLVTATAAAASLLLNMESVFTALLAWFLFRENFDRRIALGMAAIVMGGAILAGMPSTGAGLPLGGLLIVAACLCWAVDNNLTRRVSASDATLIASLKGVVAAAVNTGLALALGHGVPSLRAASAAALVGFFGYGVSLALFVVALRRLGTARAGAYFSVAPFFGALVALALQQDSFSWPLALAGALMSLGVWVHVSERHSHEHAHEFVAHSHAHTHDDHHRHSHEHWDGREPHTHAHVHEPMTHSHAHYPDLHHRHPH